jgi:hypothetical protein
VKLNDYRFKKFKLRGINMDFINNLGEKAITIINTGVTQAKDAALNFIYSSLDVIGAEVKKKLKEYLVNQMPVLKNELQKALDDGVSFKSLENYLSPKTSEMLKEITKVLGKFLIELFPQIEEKLRAELGLTTKAATPNTTAGTPKIPAGTPKIPAAAPTN